MPEEENTQNAKRKLLQEVLGDNSNTDFLFSSPFTVFASHFKANQNWFTKHWCRVIWSPRSNMVYFVIFPPNKTNRETTNHGRCAHNPSRLARCCPPNYCATRRRFLVKHHAHLYLHIDISSCGKTIHLTPDLSSRIDANLLGGLNRLFFFEGASRIYGLLFRLISISEDVLQRESYFRSFTFILCFKKYFSQRNEKEIWSKCLFILT